MEKLKTYSKLRGRHLVLIIAISEYKPKFDNLRFPLDDAVEYEKFAIEVLGVQKNDIVMLINEKATVENIDEWIRMMRL